jgi:hypothetical protein
MWNFGGVRGNRGGHSFLTPTVIEEVNVADHKIIFFVLIIQKQRVMQNWIQFELFAETLIKTFENEFINDEIIIDW